MPQYELRDPATGRKLKITLPAPPTEEQVKLLFGKQEPLKPGETVELGPERPKVVLDPNSSDMIAYADSLKKNTGLREPVRPPKPPTVTPFSLLNTPSAATGAALGHLVDRPGDVTGALAAGAQTLKEAPFQSLEEQTSPSRELSKRVGDVGLGASLFMDMMLDPLNVVGGEPFTDLSKAAIIGGPAVATGIRKLFSRLTGEVLPQFTAKAAHPNKVLSLIKNFGSPAEAEAIGLTDWLKAKGDTAVTKTEVEEFIKGKELKLSERWLGDTIVPPKEELDALYAKKDSLKQAYEETDFVDSPEELLDPEEQLALDRQRMQIKAEFHEVSDRILELEDPAAKYDRPDLQVPGGENYRELLMTMPKPEREWQAVPLPNHGYYGIQNSAGEWAMDNSGLHPARWGGMQGAENAALARERSRMFQSGHWDEPNVLLHARMTDRKIPFPVPDDAFTKPEAKAFIDKYGLDYEQTAPPDELARYRGWQASARGPERSLFLEELQSDWHQAGREQGYRTPVTPELVEQAKAKATQATEELLPAANKLEAAINQLDSPPKFTTANREGFYSTREEAMHNFAKNMEKGYFDQVWFADRMGKAVDDPEVLRVMDEVRQASEEFQRPYSRWDLARREHQTLQKGGKGIPDAPFKGTDWMELGLKRALVEAAENNYDSISWTTGRQQSERYGNLFDNVTGVRYDPEKRRLYARQRGARRFGELDEWEMVADDIGQEQLGDYIGKDNAKRLISSEKKEGSYVRYPNGKIEGPVTAEEAQRLRDGWDETNAKVNPETGEVSNYAHVTVERRPSFELDTNEHPLEIGSRGMAQQYDESMVNIANKLAKKHGGKVEKVKMPVQGTRPDERGAYTLSTKGEDVWRLKLTPAMKEEILKRGLPMSAAVPMMGDPDQELTGTQKAGVGAMVAAAIAGPAAARGIGKMTSRLMTEVLPKIPGKSHPNRVLSAIKNFGSPEEADFIGLTKWLKGKGDTPVTAAEVGEFIEKNQVKLRETHLGGKVTDKDKADAIARATVRRDEIEAAIRGGDEELSAPGLKYPHEGAGPPEPLVHQAAEILAGPPEYRTGHGQTILDALSPRQRAIAEELVQVDNLTFSNPEDVDWMAEMGGVQRGSTPRYSSESLRLPGGENYRELLVQMPSDRTQLPEGYKTVDVGPGLLGDGPHEQRYGVYNRSGYQVGTLQSSPEAAIKSAYDMSPEMGAELGEYRSPHWSEPNVLAHARMTDRTTADGKKALFLEEIQSDWHQQGRERGYGTLEKDPRYQKFDELTQKWYGSDVLSEEGRARGYTGRKLTAISESIRNNRPTGADLMEVARDTGKPLEQVEREWTDLQEAAAEFHKAERELGKAVPDAPFKGTGWQDLTFKRALIEAAEKGHDEVAWTTGRQQAERYNKLLSDIQSVEWNPDTGEVTMVGKDSGGIRTRTERGITTREQLAELVGKDAANRVADNPYHMLGDPAGKLTKEERAAMHAEKTAAGEKPSFFRADFSDKPLELGSKGMDQQYDQNLVQIAKKIGKKYGVTPGKTKIATTYDPKRWKIVPAEEVGERMGEFAVVDHETGDYTHGYPTRTSAQEALRRHRTDDRIANQYAKKEEVWSLKITPEMREEIMKKGFPMAAAAPIGMDEDTTTGQKLGVGAMAAAAIGGPAAVRGLARLTSRLKTDMMPKLVGKSHPNKVLSAIRNYASPEEAEAIGLTDWLKRKGNTPVTPGEVERFIETNKVDLKEKWLSADRYGPNPHIQQMFQQAEAAEQAAESMMAEAKAKLPTLQEKEDLHEMVMDVATYAKTPDLIPEHLRPIVEPIAQKYQEFNDLTSQANDALDEWGDIGAPRYSSGNLQLPGGENYRELLLQMPEPEPAPLEVGELKPIHGDGVAYQGNREIKGVQQADFQIGDEHGRITYWPETEQLRGSPSAARFEVNSPNMQNARFSTLDEAKNAIEQSYVGAGPGGRYMYDARKDIYRSGHWREPNVLAHARMTDRVLPDGQKALFLEEIQSDWHQGGRQHGYRDVERQRALRKEHDEVLGPANGKTYGESLEALDRWHYQTMGESRDFKVREFSEQVLDHDLQGAIYHASQGGSDAVDTDRIVHEVISNEFAKTGHYMPPELVSKLKEHAKNYAAALKSSDELETLERAGVPDAPFKGTDWQSLTMKRALIDAAENGYDQIAWTTGRQQSARYNKLLSDVVEADYTPETQNLRVLTKNGRWKTFERVPKKDLPGILGDEGARRLLASEHDNWIVRGKHKQTGKPHEESLYPDREGAERVRDYLLGTGDWEMEELRQGGEMRLSGPGRDKMFKASFRDKPLEIGSKGMNKQYDENMVNIANKLAKKYGVEAVQTDVQTQKPMLKNIRMVERGEGTGIYDVVADKIDSNERYVLASGEPKKEAEKSLKNAKRDEAKADKREKVWSLKITPEMRKDILEKGLPMAGGAPIGAAAAPDSKDEKDDRALKLFAALLGGASAYGLMKNRPRARIPRGGHILEQAVDDIAKNPMPETPSGMWEPGVDAEGRPQYLTSHSDRVPAFPPEGEEALSRQRYDEATGTRSYHVPDNPAAQQLEQERLAIEAEHRAQARP